MKILYRIGLLLLALSVLASCSKSDVKGNGNITTQARKLPMFHQVSVSGAYRIQVIAGNSESLRLTGDSNILPMVVTQVKQNVLTVKNKPGVTFRVKNPVLVQITVPKIDRITASGANQINASRIASNQFTFKTSGAVQANLSGMANHVLMKVSGSSNINADRLVAKNVDVRLTGSGHILVNASKSLNTKITGSGNITYSGNPVDVNQTITGSGKIERLR